MNAQGFFKKVAKGTYYSSGKTLTSLAIAYAAIATLSSGQLTAGQVVEQNLIAQPAPMVHVIPSHMMIPQ